MAALCKQISTEFHVLSRNILGVVCSTSFQRQGVRCLYSPAALGMDSYIKTRERVNIQFQNISEKFRTKMKEATENETSTSMIFTEDLKNMVHLTEKADIDLVLKMIQRFNKQNKSMRFGNFIFGPVIMRLFYHLNEAEIAYNAFMNPELDSFFDQLMSYQILMDLLLKNNMLEKVIEVFETIQNKQIAGSKYPKNVVVLVYAAWYKMNTPESLKRATELWSELQKVGHIPMRRAAVFAAALALNQNAPHIALEILSSVSRPNYVSVRNLKIEALADIGRPEDTFPLFRSVIESDNPQVKLTVSKESLDKVKEALKKLGKEDLQAEFDQLEKRLIGGEHILDTPQGDWILSEIMEPRNLDRERRYLAASFNRQESRQGQFGGNRFDEPEHRPRRPGLAQMY